MDEKAKNVIAIIRALPRPYLTFIFASAVVAIGILVVLKLLPETVTFIDRELSLIIITAILTVVTMMVTATTIIMGFYFGERASKKPEDK